VTFRRIINWVIGLPIAVIVNCLLRGQPAMDRKSPSIHSRAHLLATMFMPLWALFFVGIFFGMLTGWIACWFAQGKWRRRRKEARSDLQRAQDEAQRLKRETAGQAGHRSPDIMKIISAARLPKPPLSRLVEALRQGFRAASKTPVRHQHATSDVAILLLMPAWSKDFTGSRPSCSRATIQRLAADHYGELFLIDNRHRRHGRDDGRHRAHAAAHRGSERAGGGLSGPQKRIADADGGRRRTRRPFRPRPCEHAPDR